MKKQYGVYCGDPGKYGMYVPVSEERARRLAKRHSAGYRDMWYRGRTRGLALNVCPTEVRFAFDHHAAPTFGVCVTWV